MQNEYENSNWIQSVSRNFLENERNRYLRILNLLFIAENLSKDIERSGYKPLVFSRRFPLACWLSFILAISLKPFIMCLAFDEYHFQDILSRKHDLCKATVVWSVHFYIVYILLKIIDYRYLIFFCPGDLIQGFCQIDVVYLLLNLFKDLTCLRMCLRTVCLAKKVYGEEPLIVIILGTISGNAHALFICIPRLVRGYWAPSSSEILRPKL